MTLLQGLLALVIVKVILDALAPTIEVGLAARKEARARRALRGTIERLMRDRYFGYRQGTIPGQDRWAGRRQRAVEEQDLQELVDHEFLRHVADIYENEEVQHGPDSPAP